MKTLRSTTIAIVATVGLGVMALTACGGSENAGSAEAFCESLTRLDASDVDPETDFDGAVEALGDLESNAPSAVKADVATFIDVLKRVDDAGDDAEYADFEIDLEEMFASIENIQTYANEKCDGLPTDLFD